MLKETRFKVVRWILVTTLVFALMGTPIIAPVYADCSTSSCTNSD